jgi:hypothetical protein
MTEQLYPIPYGDVTLYVRSSGYSGTQFETVGLTIEGDNNFYMPHVSNFSRVNLNGRPCVDLSEMLFAHYKSLADAQLQDYLERHINDTLDPLTFKQFWHDIGKQPKPEKVQNLQLEHMIDGLIGVEIGNAICVYNLAANEPAGYSERYYSDRALATTPMRVFYGNQLSQLLALEQYKRGLAPPVYSELARLQAFLEGKKSLKLVMKDGAEHTLKHHSQGDVYLRMLLDYNGGFSLYDSYDCKPHLNGNSLADLDYLQYGKQRFMIDAAALGQFVQEDASE